MPAKPVSHKKLAANRANARKSTGPRTPHGKARSSRNALRHGLFAEHIVLPDDAENVRELHAIRDRLWADLQPRSFIEEMLIERLAASYWRLRRAYRFEANAIRDLRAKPPDPIAAIAQQLGVVAAAPHSPAELPPDPDFDKLLRYEAMIDRTLHRLLLQLAHLRHSGLLPSSSPESSSTDPAPRASTAATTDPSPQNVFDGTNPPHGREPQDRAATQTSTLTRVTKRPPRNAATCRPSPPPKTNPPAPATNPSTPPTNRPPPPTKPPPPTSKPAPPSTKPPPTTKPPPPTTKPPAPTSNRPPRATKPPAATTNRPPRAAKRPPPTTKPPPPTTDTC